MFYVSNYKLRYMHIYTSIYTQKFNGHIDLWQARCRAPPRWIPFCMFCVPCEYIYIYIFCAHNFGDLNTCNDARVWLLLFNACLNVKFTRASHMDIILLVVRCVAHINKVAIYDYRRVLSCGGRPRPPQTQVVGKDLYLIPSFMIALMCPRYTLYNYTAFGFIRMVTSFWQWPHI